jgi:hypothetical protein
MGGIRLLLSLLRLLFQLPLVGKKAVPQPPLAGSEWSAHGKSFVNNRREAESLDFI